jgi:hypothetical protein
MSELYKCRRCCKLLIAEEFDGHNCSPKINGKLVKIDVDYWFQAKHPQTGEDIISAKGLDGTAYWFIKRLQRPSDKVPFKPSDESLQVRKSDADFTEPGFQRFINYQRILFS